MKGFLKSAAIAAFAVAFGFSGASHAATVVINSGGTGSLDGWTMTAANGVTLIASQTGSGPLDVEKYATFNNTNSRGILFQSDGSAASSIVFTEEQIANNSGVNWSGFDYTLTGTATFTGINVGQAFIPPSQPTSGYNYTGVSLNPPAPATIRQYLTYTGSQNAGAVSVWGNLVSNDELVINPNGSSTFVFDEQPASAPAIPLPAAAMESLVGLLGLGAIASAKKIKNHLMA